MRLLGGVFKTPPFFCLNLDRRGLSAQTFKFKACRKAGNGGIFGICGSAIIVNYLNKLIAQNAQGSGGINAYFYLISRNLGYGYMYVVSDMKRLSVFSGKNQHYSNPLKAAYAGTNGIIRI